MEKLRTMFKEFRETRSDIELSMEGSTLLVINNSLIRVELSDGRLMPSVGFLGPIGTYTEEAKEALLGKSTTSAHSETPLKMNNRGVVEAIDSGKFDLGVVAVENSTEGDVSDTLKALLRAKDTHILGETILPIHHMLIGRPGETITEVFSHRQALGQCDDFLVAKHPDALKIETDSTAQAVTDIMRREGAAAIASRRVAEMSGMHILEEDIGDNPHNATRFFLIGRGKTVPTGNDATMLAFIPRDDKPGTLDHYLKVPARKKVNLTKIGSHPTGKMGKYLFVTTVDGHKNDRRVAKTLERLERRCESVKVLGSYKKALVPEGAYVPGTWNGN